MTAPVFDFSTSPNVSSVQNHDNWFCLVLRTALSSDGLLQGRNCTSLVGANQQCTRRSCVLSLLRFWQQDFLAATTGMCHYSGPSLLSSVASRILWRKAADGMPSSHPWILLLTVSIDVVGRYGMQATAMDSEVHASR